MASSEQRSGRRLRILLAGLFHETNTFAPGRMTLQDFSILLGNDILGSRGDGSPLGAFLEEAGKFDWDIFPTIDARALPGPSPDPEVLELFVHEFESRVAQDAGEIDAIFLVLHGAMAIENIADVEGDFLNLRLRRRMPEPAVRTS